MKLEPEFIDRINSFEAKLRARVIGQDDAIHEVAQVIIQGELNLTSSEEPKGCFFFLGPTGVGKTETSKAIAAVLFDSECYYPFDMSEFKHQDSIKNFIGDHTGNIGRLGRSLGNATKGVILFDEIEKAHPDIRDLFLQIYDERRITVGDGKTIDLRNFYLIMTSNIGSAKIVDSHYVPFSRIRDYVQQQVAREFRPEFIRRFRNMIVYNKLTLEDQRRICALMVDKEIRRLREEQGFEITASAVALNRLLDLGYDDKYGARNLRNVIQFHIRKAIADGILSKQHHSGKLEYSHENLKFQIIP